MSSVAYNVLGMSCSHCVDAITDEVSQVGGVAEVEVDLDAERVTIRGEGLDHMALRAAIEDAGYDVAA